MGCAQPPGCRPPVGRPPVGRSPWMQTPQMQTPLWMQTPWMQTPPGVRPTACRSHCRQTTPDPESLGHGTSGTYSEATATPVNRMTQASENITLPQTSFVGGKNDVLLKDGIVSLSSYRIPRVYMVSPGKPNIASTSCRRSTDFCLVSKEFDTGYWL